jgi:hypothetical protein
MSTRFIFFAAWCLFVFTGSAAAAYYAWSPFADGRPGASRGLYGPSHK